MDQQLDPTVQRRRLRIELRRARSKAGFTQKQVAEDLGWSPSKLLRIENGQVGISQTDLRALLTHYEVTDTDQIAAFTAMAREGRKQQMWSPFRDVLNPDFMTFLSYEASASLLRQCEQLVVPGILQTEEYARAVIHEFATTDLSERDLDRQVEARLLRQSLLEREDAPETFFILDEAAVRRWVGPKPGDARIMRDQLRKLQELSTWPQVSLQIVPFKQGFHFGMRGSFVLLEFPDAEDDDLLFLENNTTSVSTREGSEVITHYKERFWQLEEIAVDRNSVADFLGGILAEMD